MTDTQSYELQPGNRVNFVNHLPTAIRIRVVTLCGAETISALHPSAGLDMMVGTSSVRIDFWDAEEGYNGLRVFGSAMPEQRDQLDSLDAAHLLTHHHPRL